MRQILYRAKPKDKETIIGDDYYYGDLIHYANGTITIRQIETGAELEVDSETIGQFTGFKDKNGKDIYEGQLVTEVIEDKIEKDGFFIVTSRIEFKYGCWVICQVDFDYSNSEFEDYMLLYELHSCVLEAWA